MGINLQNLQKSSIPKFCNFINIAGPIAGFTAALSPLLFFSFDPHYLNIGAILTTNKNQMVRLELADQKEERLHGLKFRQALPKNQGLHVSLSKIGQPYPKSIF